jgi:hypothetical protein
VEQGYASIKNKHFIDFHSRNMVIFSKFLDFVMFGTGDLGHNAEKFKKKKNIISINHHICPIFHAENNLSKLQFNFAHFIRPILTTRWLTSFVCCHFSDVEPERSFPHCLSVPCGLKRC